MLMFLQTTEQRCGRPKDDQTEKWYRSELFIDWLGAPSTSSRSWPCPIGHSTRTSNSLRFGWTFELALNMHIHKPKITCGELLVHILGCIFNTWCAPSPTYGFHLLCRILWCRQVRATTNHSQHSHSPPHLSLIWRHFLRSYAHEWFSLRYRFRWKFGFWPK